MTETGTLADGAPDGNVLYKYSPLRTQIAQIAQQFGLTHTSGDRTPASNPGAPDSDHLTTNPDSWADDYSGSDSAMARFYTYVTQHFGSALKQVLPADHQPETGPNVHVAGYSAPDTTAPAVAPTAAATAIAGTTPTSTNATVGWLQDLDGQAAISSVGTDIGHGLMDFVAYGGLTLLAIALVFMGVLQLTGSVKTASGAPS